MSDAPVNLSRSGPPETELPEPDPASARALADAVALPADQRRDAVAAVAARWPRYQAAWAQLGVLGRDDIESYAAYRVGYHRGLDSLRGAGWRGSGYVRWAHEPNQGFLSCLQGLQRCAAAIGETDEEQRCAQFLNQLDPAEFPPPA
ncbi:MAG: DUF3151 domain-containing protein [Actinomycetia bacterium]|nr:DUF3151 domain-containing protein [Actinomycetes bacterium]